MQFVNDFEAALFKYSLRCLTLRLIAISDRSALRISGLHAYDPMNQNHDAMDGRTRDC